MKQISVQFLVFASMLAWPFPVIAQASPERAVLTIDARFEASRLADLELELMCNSGIPVKEYKTLPNDGLLDWTIEFPPDTPTVCQLATVLPLGYSASYSAQGDSIFESSPNGCQFRRLESEDLNRCRVDVSQDPVLLTVYLEWIGPSGEEPDVRVNLECESGEYSGFRYVNAGSPGSWEIRDIDPEGILCNVSEEVRETFRPDIIDCQGLLVLPGKGEACTLINTKIVKRIEMLNRYGKIIMILLVLAVGLAAARRLT
ncbi:MAG: hypothetical protein HKN57_13935 [Xanthomonadales bacterium]|nr:hypothetical protein [Gammaproteobacteria bacterium]NND58342.1 hypothetical protein [Xanthomonadales bacterium]